MSSNKSKLSKKRREKIQKRCIDDHMNSVSADSNFAYNIIKDGFVGFTKMTDQELLQAYQDAGLDEQD